MEKTFITPSRSERKYTRSFQNIGLREVPVQSAVKGVASLPAVEAPKSFRCSRPV